MTDKGSRGRPTNYCPSYGEKIVNLMAEGLSLTAAAAELGFHRQRIYAWEEAHPEFADAVLLGRGKRTLKLERDLLAAPDGPTVTSRIFALKNAAPAEWRDKVEHEHAGKDGGPIEVTTDRERAKALLILFRMLEVDATTIGMEPR